MHIPLCINNIEKFITRQIQNISIKEIEHFFEDFELEDFNLLINDYNYTKGGRDLPYFKRFEPTTYGMLKGKK